MCARASEAVASVHRSGFLHEASVGRTGRAVLSHRLLFFWFRRCCRSFFFFAAKQIRNSAFVCPCLNAPHQLAHERRVPAFAYHQPLCLCIIVQSHELLRKQLLTTQRALRLTPQPIQSAHTRVSPSRHFRWFAVEIATHHPFNHDLRTLVPWNCTIRRRRTSKTHARTASRPGVCAGTDRARISSANLRPPPPRVLR